ncbi:MAG: hypothetical protein ACRDHL_00280 [Candidatus Promineifilaceae bacterium]
MAAGVVQFPVLTGLAMLLYPGGTYLDRSAQGYRFFANFFSDLGRTLAHNGQPNTLSMLLFGVALTIAGLALMLFFAALAGMFRRPASRALATAGTLMGVASGIGYVGVALTPADLFGPAHSNFVRLAFLAFLGAVVCFQFAILMQPGYPNRFGLIFAGFALLLSLYVWLLFGGPGISSAPGLLVQVAGQKVIAYAALATALIEALGASRLLSADIYAL